MQVERCFEVLPKGVSHSDGELVRALACQNAAEIRYRLQEPIQTLALIPRKDFGYYPFGCLYKGTYTTTC